MNVGGPPATSPVRPTIPAKLHPELRDMPPSSPPLVWDVINDREAASGAYGAADLPLPGQTAFASETAVGDPAVRFDARPIVAPSAEQPSATAADCLTERGAGMTPTMPNGDSGVTALAVLVQDMAGHLAAAASSGTKVSLKDGIPHPAAHPLPAGNEPPVITAPSGSRERVLVARTGAAGLSLPASPIRAALERGPSARIAMFGAELRVLIRGMTLSADDTATIEQIARDALGGSPLAGHAVRVISSGRR